MSETNKPVGELPLAGDKKGKRRRKAKSGADRKPVSRVTARKVAAEMGPEFERAIDALGSEFVESYTRALISAKHIEGLKERRARVAKALEEIDATIKGHEVLGGEKKLVHYSEAIHQMRDQIKRIGGEAVEKKSGQSTAEAMAAHA
jgi:hypothetical protein